MWGFSGQGVTTVQTLISISGLFNDCHDQGWEWAEYSLHSFMLTLQTCPIPVRGHGRPVLAVEKQQPHSLVLRSGTPRVNISSRELFAHSHIIYYWETPVKDIMIFRA